jgi:dipeptidyl aminopeptidase/acylaminoacyl peptidase
VRTAFAIALWVVAFAPVLAAGSDDSIVRVFDDPVLWQMAMSPDGRKVAWVQDPPDRDPEMVILDRDADRLLTLPFRTPVGPEGARYEHIAQSLRRAGARPASFVWVNNHRIAMQIGLGPVWSFEDDGTDRKRLVAERTYLDEVRVPVLYRRLDDRHVLVISIGVVNNTRDFEVIDVYRGDSRPVFLDKYEFDEYLVDAGGHVRIGARYDDGGELSLFHRADDQAEFVPIDLGLAERSGGAAPYPWRRVALLGFGADPDRFYFASAMDRNTVGIYEFDLASGTHRPVFPHDERYDLMDVVSGRFDSPLVFSRVDRRLLGMEYVTDRPAARWLDDHFRAIQDKLDAALGQTTNLLLDWSTDADAFVVCSTSDREPGVYRLFDARANTLEPIASEHAGLDRALLSPMQPIEYSAHDGTRIAGYLTTPADESQVPPYPLVVVPHGGPWLRDALGFDPVVQFLAGHGYAVLQVNFRGSTGYGLQYVDAGRMQLGDAMQTDLIDGIDYCVHMGLVDSSRVAIVGTSYGGYAAMMGVLQFAPRFRCAVAISGFYDLPRDMEDMRKHDPAAYQFWSALAVRPDEAMQISPIGYVHDLSRPVMIVHGREDQVCRFEQAKELEKRLKMYGKPHRVLWLAGEGHGYWKARSKRRVYGEVIEFLKENMGR